MQDPLTPDSLRAARVAAHLSQRELAARLGVRPIAVSEWELGRAPIGTSPEQLEAALARGPADADDLFDLALRHMELVEHDTAVMRKQVEAVHRRVREAIGALRALREQATR